MNSDREELVYNSSRKEAILTPCSICSCSDAASQIRARRRCRSEDLEPPPYRSLAYNTEKYQIICNQNSERRLPSCPIVANKNTSHRDFINRQNIDCTDDRYSNRTSPDKYNTGKSSIKNCDSLSSWHNRVYTRRLIENAEPRLFTVDEYQEKFGGTLDDRPRSTGLNQGRTSSFISGHLNSSRRSVSPNFFRKSKGRPPPEWNEVDDVYVSNEGRRRVRARSESEKCSYYIKDRMHPTVIKCSRDNSYSKYRNRDEPKQSRNDFASAQPYSCSNGTESYSNGHVSHRDIGVGDWSIFDNVTVPTCISKKCTKSGNSKLAISKGKLPNSKSKSRLMAIKAKKSHMETYSTGSDLSEDELSDIEDGASKVSLDRESDMSIEPVDHQECLTSDSGPSVSSVSDSASLTGLSSALTSNAVVSTSEDGLSSMLRPSLFPNVPPYLRFVSHDSTPLRPPTALHRHLRWKLTTITPVVVRKTLINSGFKLIRSEGAAQGEPTDWIGTWGKHMKSVCFRGLKESQKVNHFPGTFQIGRKDRLWKNLHKLMMKYGYREFGLMPKTYVLPQDMKTLKYDWDKYAALNDKWIIKPPASARGTGIKVVARWAQIPKRRPVVVQHYIARPYLINDSKFDLRLYVAVMSIHPLRIYLYPDGLARFASVKYSEENNSLQDRYMHLTNYSINRLSKTYTHNQDAGACQGHKWTLQALLNYLKKERGINTHQLWNSMKELVIKTILSGESSISCLTKSNIGSHFNCYELFGIDVLLDDNLKPWLLEVNISPSLHSASPLDLHVKGPLVKSILNMAQFHVPAKVNIDELNKEKTPVPILQDKRLYTVHLSKEEKAKHSYFADMEDRSDYLDDILTNLTPDDVRHLILAEDEYTQKANLEKIFPTPDTYPYLEYLAGPRYYNRLFDAWEHKYGSNRKLGIKRLQDLCEKGVHLEVPPMPAKSEDVSTTEVPTPMQEESAIIETEPMPVESETLAGHDCSTEGKHIVGEFCMTCRPSIPLLLQSEGQPLPVQQHA